MDFGIQRTIADQLIIVFRRQIVYKVLEVRHLGKWVWLLEGLAEDPVPLGFPITITVYQCEKYGLVFHCSNGGVIRLYPDR